MAKANATYYKVSVFSDNGIITVSGDIIEMNDSAIIARYRKSGSSKFAMRTIARTNLVGYSGGIGKPSEIMFRGRKVERILKNCVIEPSKNGMIMVNHTDTNSIYYFDPMYVEAIAEKDVEAPSSSLVYKKPKLSKGKSSKSSKDDTKKTKKKA